MSGRILFAALGALAICAGEARTFEVALWRGETTAAVLPDYCELGGKAEGYSIKAGRLAKVDYAPKPGSYERISAYDRVVWGDAGTGPRVVEIAAAANAKAGVYTNGMLRVRIVDRVLPPPGEWKYYLDLWQHPWAVARVAGVEPFSPEHYAAMKPVWELLATAGQKTITVSLLDEPWDHQCFDAYRSMFPNGEFKLFDEYVEFCRGCGLGPEISCYSLCPWTAGKEIDEAELEKRWGSFLDRFAAHLKAKGWFERTIMAMDERAPEDVRKIWNFVQRHAPGMKISMAGNRRPSDFDGIAIDRYSQVLFTDCVTDAFLAEAASRRARGFVTTHYVCCGPAKPNTMFESERGEAFWCGFAPAALGLDGFLRWAWNSWPENPSVDASYGEWRAGDTFLVYPGGEPSRRFLELRCGIVAAEKARILREAGEVSPELEKTMKSFSVRDANEGKCDYRDLMKKVTDAVNAEEKR